jgi:integrase/recombinase XerD
MAQAKVLDQKEVKRVFAVIANSKHAARNRIAFALTYYAGLRVKEVAELKFGDCYDNSGQALSEIQLRADQTKGNKGRKVIINTKLQRELNDYAKTVPNSNNMSSIVGSQKGNGFSPNSLAQLFRHIYELAGVTGATSHSGRRSFITDLANKGVGAKVLMTLAGHKNLATTQRYIEVNDGQLRQAAELMS